MPIQTTYAILADVYIDGNASENYTGFNGYQELNESFISLHNFLTGSECASLGITRIASNFGFNGSGMGYWDSSTPAGENAWACFKFASASVPFCMLVQYSGRLQFGSSPGNPGSISDSSRVGLAFSFAFTNDLSSPWRGTTFNNGLDVKSTPVWEGDSSNLMCFPRVNSYGGEDDSTKSGMVSLATVTGFEASYSNGNNEYFYSKRGIFHYVVSNDQFIGVFDIGGMGIMSVVYFGKYDKLSDITGNTEPYCMLCINDCKLNYSSLGQSAPFGSKQLINSIVQLDPRTGKSGNASVNGGVVNSNRNSVGSLMTGYIGYASGTQVATSFPTSIGEGNSRMYHNTSINNGCIEMMKIPIGWQEKFTDSSSEFYPIPPITLGKLSFIRGVSSVPTNAKLSKGKWLVIGPAFGPSYKYAIPWSPSYKGPYYTNTREGVKMLETQNL